MKNRSTCVAGWASLVCWLGAAAPAFADESQAAAAEALFQEGNRLAQAGNFAEACPKFAASNSLDPGYGVLFNLAECHEKNGQTASAWAEFRLAVAMAKKSGEAAREEKATRRAAALEPRLVRLFVRVKGSPEGLVVKRDGAVVDPAGWNTPVPVDPGAHVVEASAPGKRAWRTSVQAVKEGQVVTVELPALEADVPAIDAKPAAPPALTPGEPAIAPSADAGPAAPPARFPAQRAAALAVGGAGVAGVVVGTIFGIRAKSRWDDAQANHCHGEDRCDATGVALAGKARIDAHVSTGTFIAGGAGIVGAVVLWATAKAAPRRVSKLQVVPSFQASSAGVLVGGSF